MAETRHLLIEIGTEELPPKALHLLSEAFEAGIRDGLSRKELGHGVLTRFAAPRRLAVLVHDLIVVQPERRVERRGPALAAAFDAAGNPSKATEGFARSCGVTVAELDRVETAKGAWLAYHSIVPGALTATLIPEIVETALKELPIPRRMRWGNGSEEFVRPVHWVVMLFGDDVVPGTILGVRAGRNSHGHRFHHPGPIPLPRAAAYAAVLAETGKVLADFGQRREAIRSQASHLASERGGTAVIEPALLDEVTALVEWPVALVGNFEPRFLAVPHEALITTMQDNQKYFPIVDAQQRLLPHFITIANIESRDPAKVRAGNERVIRPRFADAEFFWNQDRKTRLESHQPALKNVVFQQRLGSLYDKSERVAALARTLARSTGGSLDGVEHAARLAKCDLLTTMVQEFPELQGTMGHYYAKHDGEPAETARAIEEQYWPRFAGDAIPSTTTGRILALAERTDTLVGIFAIGQGPSGNKDPFALRRAALGALRIIIEGGLDIDLPAVLHEAAAAFPHAVRAETAIDTVLDFMFERLRGYYIEQGFKADAFEAVAELRPSRPLDFDRRIRAVTEFRQLPEAESLAAANKRIRNILRKLEGELPFAVHTELLVEPAELALAAALAEIASEAVPMLEASLYAEGLTRLAGLRAPVDAFFDTVLVMADDAALRQNRIALLNELGSLFLRVADLSKLSS